MNTAIATLQASKETYDNNAPIQRAEGRDAEASHSERASAEIGDAIRELQESAS